MEMDEQRRLKFLGAMIGSALGDAIGELAFLNPEKGLLEDILSEIPELCYTVDTAMAIGLAEAISQSAGIDERFLGDTFAANYFREPWRGYAAGPPAIFSAVKKEGTTYSDAAARMFKGMGSFGNGAAMRITPAALFFYDSEELYEQVSAASRVTHVHPVGVDGAAVLALAISSALRFESTEEFPFHDFMGSLIDFARTAEIRKKLEQVHDLFVSSAGPERAKGLLGSSVAVQESMPFALYSFLSHRDSYEDCLFCAVLNGGDRDTIGAMACAVSGAYLGIEAIPWKWKEKLENRSYIEHLAFVLEDIIY